jgi:hypothetical protein
MSGSALLQSGNSTPSSVRRRPRKLPKVVSSVDPASTTKRTGVGTCSTTPATPASGGITQSASPAPPPDARVWVPTPTFVPLTGVQINSWPWRDPTTAQMFLLTRAPEHNAPRPLSAPAQWQPDEAADTCQICHTGFDMLIRRHHCRNCGILVCDACSPFRMPLPHLNLHRLERVCSPCKVLLDKPVIPSTTPIAATPIAATATATSTASATSTSAALEGSGHPSAAPFRGSFVVFVVHFPAAVSTSPPQPIPLHRFDSFRTRTLRLTSPFSPSKRQQLTETEFQRPVVWCFELLADAITGLDYQNKLTFENQRLVLEGHSVRRHQFASVHDAVRFFCPGALPPAWLPPHFIRDPTWRHLYTATEDPLSGWCQAQRLTLAANGVVVPGTVVGDRTYACDPAMSPIASTSRTRLFASSAAAAAPDAAQPSCSSDGVLAQRGGAHGARNADDIASEPLGGHCTVILEADDPLFHYAVRNAVLGHQQLTHLCEAGLYSWAVVLPSWGIPYHPLYRTVYDVAMLVFAAYTLFVGFHQLYLNSPAVREFFEGAWGDIADWFEEQVRSVCVVWVVGVRLGVYAVGSDVII